MGRVAFSLGGYVGYDQSSVTSSDDPMAAKEWPYFVLFQSAP